MSETTKKMYGWTKYGGARKGMVMEELDEWFCQACGRPQPKEAPAYMVPLDEDIRREFVRVCAVCRDVEKKKGYTVFEQVSTTVRLTSIYTFANLLSLPSKI